jgi:predicted amidohydrolase
VFNTHLLLAPDGEVAAVYRKIHLFDVNVPNGDERSHFYFFFFFCFFVFPWVVYLCRFDRSN